MVKIADLIKENKLADRSDCDLIVNSQTPVRQVLQQMEELNSDHVGVEVGSDSTLAIITKQDLLQGVLNELDHAGEKLGDLENLIDQEISAQLDLAKLSSRSIAEAEKYMLEVAINYMTEGLVILGTDNQVRKCNPAAKKFFALRGNENNDEFSDILDDYGFRRLLTENKKKVVENWGEFTMKSPSEAIIKIRWTEMVDESGDVLGSLAMLRDVTDEIAGDRAKTEFIAAITHELRTPLTIIQNSVSNILAGVTGKISKKMHSYLKTIEGDCKRFGILISDLLDISKIEGGHVMLNRQVFNLDSIISAEILKHQSAASEKKIKLISTPVDYVSPVYADRDRIEQTLGNLIDNAIKFTEEGGSVTVGCYEETGEIVAYVKDNGIGLSMAQQSLVFNKFHQVGRQAGAGYKGMGLGLSVCKGVVELHGGEIWVDSKEGQGSEFFFSLPKMDPSRILNRHIETMAKDYSETGEDFAYLTLRFDINGSDHERYSEVIGTSIHDLLNNSQRFMNEKKDLVIHHCDSEVVFVVSNARKRRIESVKKHITKIVKKLQNNNWNGAPIVPIIGIGIFPADSNDVIELENIARKSVDKLL